jgi:YARHG domain-containing protein
MARVAPIVWTLIFFASTLCCLAEERHEIESLLPNFRIFSVKTVEEWCVLGVTYPGGDADGQALLHRQSGHWRVLVLGGGALSSEHLYHLGVPLKLLDDFGFRLDQESLENIRESDPGWPDGSRALLSEKGLRFYSSWELKLMLYTLYARHGLKFGDSFYSEYFRSRPWYRENPNFAIESLNATETANIALLVQQIAAKPHP